MIFYSISPTFYYFPFKLHAEGEVIDPSREGASPSENDVPNSGHVDSDECSGVSSELTEAEQEDVEDQSPEVSSRDS